eukprot:10442009-Heterocapsa_arctica.AAC.1
MMGLWTSRGATRLDVSQDSFYITAKLGHTHPSVRHANVHRSYGEDTIREAFREVNVKPQWLRLESTACRTSCATRSCSTSRPRLRSRLIHRTACSLPRFRTWS